MEKETDADRLSSLGHALTVLAARLDPPKPRQSRGRRSGRGNGK